MRENSTLRRQELQMLGHIFGDQWKQSYDLDDTYSIKISEDIELWITLSPEYPLDKPPSYDLWAPKLNPQQKDQVDKQFAKIFSANQDSASPGVIFDWIELLKGMAKPESPKMRSVKGNKTEKSTIKKPSSEKVLIVHGPAVSDRKSTFQAHVCRISHPSEARDLVEVLRENKKISQAKHNILAYRVECGKKIDVNYDEDGENLAGGRLVHLLEKLKVCNVAVVVTRWYGGVHLGADRFKHINNAAHQALIEGGFISR